MDGTGLAPVPDKVKGHLSLALNAFCPVILTISSQCCSAFHLLVPLWQPLLPIKGGPWRTGEGFGSLEPGNTQS